MQRATSALPSPRRQVSCFPRYSWEDEPEDRSPMDSAARNREWIERRLAG